MYVYHTFVRDVIWVAIVTAEGVGGRVVKEVKPIEAVSRLGSSSVQTVFRQCSDSVQVVSRQYSGSVHSVQAVYRRSFSRPLRSMFSANSALRRPTVLIPCPPKLELIFIRKVASAKCGVTELSQNCWTRKFRSDVWAFFVVRKSGQARLTRQGKPIA